ncbi:hypothetical protein EDD18DRAFT_1113159 [Armillaria luteobubalina]|uniref:Transmembrane protein n=1 Tax=Armillaria luteobubalina TaxID=153913 RepID=A0AA39PBW9_9AGAR|nr:hypothetical protein EDD18DRAFT_1113159 [Armillaria luteobubalina]
MALNRHDDPGPVFVTIVTLPRQSLGSSDAQTTSIPTVSSDLESSLNVYPSDSESTSTRESAVSSTGGTSPSATRYSQAFATKVIASAITSSSPSKTPSYTSHSHPPQHTATRIGAALGTIVFFLLLSLGGFLLRRWRNTQSSARFSPSPILMRRSSSPQTENILAKSRREPQMSSDENPLEHLESVSEGGVVQEGDRSPPEDDMLHARTSRAMDDEALAEILRLGSQIQQLIAERATAYRELDPPPAYIEDGAEDLSR